MGDELMQYISKTDFKLTCDSICIKLIGER